MEQDSDVVSAFQVYHKPEKCNDRWYIELVGMVNSFPRVFLLKKKS